MNTKISREQAERLADELLALQPRQGGTGLAKTIGNLFALRPLRHEFNRNPLVSPAAPAWEVWHRDTDTSK